MARIVDQHYFKTIIMPEITSAVVTDDVLTITGVDIDMRFRPTRTLRLGFSTSPDLTISWPNILLTSTSANELVIDLSDYDGENLTDLTYTYPNVISIDFNVNPDDDIETPAPPTPPNITAVALNGTDVEITGTDLDQADPFDAYYSINLWFPAVDGGNYLQINMSSPETYPWMTVSDTLITLDTTAVDAQLDYFSGETFSEVRVTYDIDDNAVEGPLLQTFDVNPDLVLP